MPICHMKCGERPSESRERNTAIHHWIFLDICGVIESDELMPDYLRVNPKRHHRETEQDDEIGRFNLRVWLSGTTFLLFAAVTRAVFLFRAVRLAIRRETTRGRTIEMLRVENVQTFWPNPFAVGS